MRSIRNRDRLVINSLGTSALVFFGAFSVAFLASSNFAPAQDSSAAEVSVSSDASGYFASISTLGSVGAELYPSYSGNAKIAKDTVTVTTNAKNGYKLYIGTPSTAAGTALYDEEDDTKTIPASSGTPASPARLAKDTWGYAPARSVSSATAQEYTDADVDPSTGSEIMIGVPAYGSENVLYTNTTPTDSATNSLDVYYGVNVSTATKPGTYSNAVVYTAIVDAITPGSKEASIAPASQDGLEAGTSVTISTGLYPGFSAENMGEITVTIGGNACTNVTPSVAEAGNLNITCTAPAASAAGKYDVVVNVAKYNKTYTLTEGYEYVAVDYMQDFSAAAHATDAVGTTYALSDSRDKTKYTAAKLADGNIWMTQDLKLDGGKTLTSADSDVSSNYTLPAENTGTWCTTGSAACDNQSLMRKTGAPNGYFYNWYAATAGTGVYGTGANQNASASICPKGWKLPTMHQYVALDVAYGGGGYNRTDATQRNKFMAAPLNFNYTGYVNGGSVSYPSDRALYWSRTASSETGAFNLNFRSDGYFNPQDYSNKYFGFAVRCVADDNAMQGFKASDHSSDATDTTYELVDNRDGQKYTAAKLADGNIWMTKDLKLDGGRTLTSADSDVSSNYTLPAENTGTWCTSNDATCLNQSLMIKTGAPNGYLYNWYAATAGTGVYDTGGRHQDTTATASICPKGWKLPSKDDYVALDQAYGGSGTERSYYDTTQVNKFLASPLNFNYTGSRSGGSIYRPSDDVYYWARTAYSEMYAYSLHFNSRGNFNPQGSGGKGLGFAVRCVAAS